jgi:hypothetical protein
VNATHHLAKEQIGSTITAEGRAKVDEEAVLKGVGFYVHLHGSNRAAKANLVVAPNHVERINDGENVGPALEGSETTIT